MPEGPLQRVNGQIAGDDDRDRIEDGTVHVLGRCQDDFVQVIALAFAQRQFAVDVFHHHHGAVNDDAEIDGANGEQVGGDIVRVQNDEGEQQRQRNGERDDHRRAEADQEEDQDDQHQHHAAQQVVFHRVGGELHQFAAVVVGVDLDVLGQDVLVELLGLCLDAFQHILRLLAAPHQDDAFDRIIVLLEAELAQARGVADAAPRRCP